jgi:hypothetical protein
LSGGFGRGGDLGVLLGVGTFEGEVSSFNRGDELGELALADYPSVLLLGLEHPGGGPSLAHVAVVPALDVALGVTYDLDHLTRSD